MSRGNTMERRCFATSTAAHARKRSNSVSLIVTYAWTSVAMDAMNRTVAYAAAVRLPDALATDIERPREPPNAGLVLRAEEYPPRQRTEHGQRRDGERGAPRHALDRDRQRKTQHADGDDDQPTPAQRGGIRYETDRRREQEQCVQRHARRPYHRRAQDTICPHRPGEREDVHGQLECVELRG